MINNQIKKALACMLSSLSKETQHVKFSKCLIGRSLYGITGPTFSSINDDKNDDNDDQNKPKNDSIKNKNKSKRRSKQPSDIKINFDLDDESVILKNNMTNEIEEGEKKMIDEFENQIPILNDPSQHEANDKSKKQSFESEAENADMTPLIYWTQPILPHSQFTIIHPNRNDLFFGLLLKYGKLKVIDENTTLIEDICLFHDREDLSRSKAILQDYVLGTKCEVVYKKGLLVIKGLDLVYRIKSFKPGKYKFFNIKETQKHKIKCPSLSFINFYHNTLNASNEIEVEFDEPLQKVSREEFIAKFQILIDYSIQCLEHLKWLTFNTNKLNKACNLDEEYFGDNNQSFHFTFKDIQKNLEFFDTELVSIKEKFLDSKENASETLNLLDIYVLFTKLYGDLSKYAYYFTLKYYSFSNLIYGNSKDFVIIQYTIELSERLKKMSEIAASQAALIELKYDFYKFPKQFKFNLTEPFRNKTEEDVAMINKYKEIVDLKISEVDQIEKEKENISQKLSKIVNMPTEVRAIIDKELSKISSVNYESENGKRFEYLNHVTSLPWDNRDTPKWDLEYAKSILDANLFGLEETKQRIYEFIAKNMRTNNRKGCVLLLSGGPGTGKTRIAKLIGEALQRKVGFISLAGISDGKTILGFKRTYISSTPGVFIREMQKVNTINPVIVIDEIDKVNVRYGYSNVFNSLLQLMNPEENSRFTDHYLEFPFDFSNVIFILTSNNNEIFAPLLDRMEVIMVDPYVYYEKFLIAKHYALKQILKEYHLETLEFTDQALYQLIYNHCKNEAGVRKLKKLLENIVRKITSKIELGQVTELLKQEVNTVNIKEGGPTTEEEQEILLKYLQVNSDNILKILDEVSNEDSVLSKMISERHVGNDCGMCLGLFVSKTDQLNSWGDASVFSVYLTEKKTKKLNESIKKIRGLITENVNSDTDESSKKPEVKDHEKSGLFKSKDFSYTITSTGNLGEDSIQSLHIALDVAQEMLNKIDPQKFKNFYLKHEIHYDCPQILQPKSGPSAGTVAFLCCISAALNKPIIANIAMTGEIAIDGRVLKIGGVKEKCQGAQRYGVQTLVLPIGNKNDFVELQSNLKNSFKKVYFVRTAEEVYKIGLDHNTEGIDCFVGVNEEKINFEKEILMSNNLLNKMF